MKSFGKRMVLVATLALLLLTVAVFAVLLWRADRNGDMNNEDTLVKLATAAIERDDPPAAALYYHRLTKLNQFHDGYRESYFHALVRLRDSETLAAYTNECGRVFALTERERDFDRMMELSAGLRELGSNEVARTVLVQATNLNYFAAAPELIECDFSCGRLADALDIIREYSKRFRIPRLFVEGVELSALANRPDLIPEFTRNFPASGRHAMIFALYGDVLSEWAKGDYAKASETMKKIGDEVHTPVSRLVELDVACAGDDVNRVQIAWINLMNYARFMDFAVRGKLAVRRFLAAHFPDRLPIADLGKIADEVLKAEAVHETGKPDVAILRVSLFAKLVAKTLQPEQLEEAERHFPEDPGIRKIREQYRREILGDGSGR